MIIIMMIIIAVISVVWHLNGTGERTIFCMINKNVGINPQK